MAETSRHDAWQAGDSYDLYMGRWSRQIAPLFLDWLAASEGLDWLDVGCGTGVLSAAVVDRQSPKSLLGIDPSDGFLATARANVPDGRAEFRVGDAQELPVDSASRDVVVSALVLNFVPRPANALAEMKRAARADGTVGFYVWDYPGGGVEFIRAFWQAAIALAPDARDLAEDRRFPLCTPEGLIELAAKAGLASVECAPLQALTVFRDFADYWHPFTLGAGPAPGYCASLDLPARQRLRDRLEETLPREKDDSIHLRARAWAIKASVS